MTDKFINLEELNLQIKPEYNSFEFQGQEVKVLKYLPMKEKNDLIIVTLQRIFVDGTLNPVVEEIEYELNLIRSYSNVIINEANSPELYDKLLRSGFIDLFYQALDKEDGEELLEFYNKALEELKAYSRSTAGMIASILNKLPEQMDKAQSIINDFDKTKFQEVIQFAEAANGNRNINTNEPVKGQF